MPPRPAPKPKPVVPITEAMKAGKEPMRTFGDLMQFFHQGTETPAAPPEKQVGKEKKKAAKPASEQPVQAPAVPLPAEGEQPVEQRAVVEQATVERAAVEPATAESVVQADSAGTEPSRDDQSPAE